MQLQLYSNTDADNKILKKPSVKGNVIAIQLKKDTSIITPEFTLSFPANVGINDVNYCQVEEWGYYYFIREKEHLLGGLYRITLELDELYTFRNDILSNYAYIGRSEYNGNENIEDSKVPLISSVTLEADVIGNFDKTQISNYLCVVGYEEQ